MTKSRIAAALAALCASHAVFAEPPSTSAYGTDPQSSYVFDATSDGIDQVNMIMCLMSKMSPHTQVNQGPYIAMVDQNKCDQKSRSSSSGAGSTSAGASATDYNMRAVVDSTRTDNSSPMIGKIWIDMEEAEYQANIFVRLRADQAPSTGNPYGVFRLDYCGKEPAGSTCVFNGYIDATSNAIVYYDGSSNPDGSETVAMNLSAGSTTSGSGNLRVSRTPTGGSTVTTTYQFAFDPTYFRRSDGTTDKCFARQLAQAKSSVWRYGTYDAVTGARVDSQNPGFPVRISYNSNTHYGYASYWGLFANGLNLNTLPDANPVPGVTIVRESRGSAATSTEYGLQKVSGKLTKFTRQTDVLASIDQIALQAWGPFYTMTGNNPTLQNVNQVELHWDNTNTQFVITGTQACDQNGCTVTPITPVVIPNTDTNAQIGVRGWSQALGGEVNIPAKATAYAGSDTVRYYTQSAVAPGGTGAPSSLSCLNNCMTNAALSAFLTSGGSPFAAATQSQWGSGSTTVAYTFDSAGLKEGGAVMTMKDASKAVGQFQWGVRTGKLFDATLPTCTFNNSLSCEPDSDYYVWETGPNAWNQFIALTSGGNAVTFDPPRNVAFVPSLTNTNLQSGDVLLGKTLQLQFQGFGELHGIPGKCVTQIDNTPVACGSLGGSAERYVPAFAITDGTSLTIGSTAALIKYLDRELRLAESPGNCSSLALPAPSGLPTGGLTDPSNSGDANYIGTKPTVTAAPKVLHGVVQP